MPGEKGKARIMLRQYLAQIWRLVRNHAEIFFLVSILQAAVNMAFFMLTGDDLASFRALDPSDTQAVTQALEQLLPAFLPSSLASVIAYSVLALIWCRVVGTGRERVFDDGFATRFLIVIWRCFGMFGYLLLLTLAATILSIVVTALGSLAGPGFGNFLSVVLTLFVLAGVAVIFLALLLAIASAALDGKSIGLLACARALNRGWQPYFLTVSLCFAAYILVNIPMTAIISADLIGGSMSLPALGVTSALGAALNLVILTAAVVAWRLVPTPARD